MYSSTPVVVKVLPGANFVSRAPLRRGFVLIALALILTWFALSQTARAEDGAVGDGSSTAEGFNALASLTTGSSNTAIGFQALFSNTTGSMILTNCSDIRKHRDR